MKKFFENPTVQKYLRLYLGVFCLVVSGVTGILFPFLFLGTTVLLVSTKFYIGFVLLLFVLPLDAFTAFVCGRYSNEVFDLKRFW